jgi:hypothetical protein
VLSVRENTSSACDTHNCERPGRGAGEFQCRYDQTVTDGCAVCCVLCAACCVLRCDVCHCRLLTAESSDRTVIHVELSLSDSGMRFAAGDAVGVLPANDPALVAAVLARLGVDGDDVFEVAPASEDGERQGLWTWGCSTHRVWWPVDRKAWRLGFAVASAERVCACCYLCGVWGSACLPQCLTDTTNVYCCASYMQTLAVARLCSATLAGPAPSGTPSRLAQVGDWRVLSCRSFNFQEVDRMSLSYSSSAACL